jgi:hypothetical protein
MIGMRAFCTARTTRCRASQRWCNSARWFGPGVLEAGDVDALDALRLHNPLLFDLVLKRRVHWRGARLANAVFQTRPHFLLPTG